MLNRNAFGTVEIEGVGTYDVELIFKGTRPDPGNGVTWSVFDGYVNGTLISEYKFGHGNTDPVLKYFLLDVCKDAEDAHRLGLRDWKREYGAQFDDDVDDIYEACIGIREQLLRVMGAEEIERLAEEATYQ